MRTTTSPAGTTPAIPIQQFPAALNARKFATCQCGSRIMDGAFGWVHTDGWWVTLGDCRSARPKTGGAA